MAGVDMTVVIRKTLELNALKRFHKKVPEPFNVTGGWVEVMVVVTQIYWIYIIRSNTRQGMFEQF